MRTVNLFIGILVLIFLSNCKKNELGGSSVIKGKVMHHSKLISHARVFIKFGTLEFPGSDTTGYDSKVICDANAVYQFNSYKGEYFLFAVGIDPAIPAPSRVEGGAPAKLRKNEELLVDLAVTEGD